MSEQVGKSRTFWLSNQNDRRLAYAKQLGVNLSKLVDTVLQDHLKGYLEKEREKRSRQLRETLAAPVP